MNTVEQMQRFLNKPGVLTWHFDDGQIAELHVTVALLLEVFDQCPTRPGTITPEYIESVRSRAISPILWECRVGPTVQYTFYESGWTYKREADSFSVSFELKPVLVDWQAVLESVE